MGGARAYGELELEQDGTEMLTSSGWGMFHPFRDRSAVMFHSFDARETYAQWKTINEHDAEVFKTLHGVLGPVMADTLHDTQYSPPTQGPADVSAEGGLASLLAMMLPEIPDNAHGRDAMERVDAVYDAERIRAVRLGEWPNKQAGKRAAEITGLSKNDLYQRALDLKDRS